MKYGIVTLYRELFAPIESGLVGRAIEGGLLELAFADPRDFTTDKHRSVDDTPYGGGSGMVLRPGPFVSAIESLDPARTRRRVLLTPQGVPFDQRQARRLLAHGDLVLVCGRFEGFDERIRSHVDEELSLGDFVLLGGELAAMAVVEATARLVPGVIGNHGSVLEESHANGLLEYPQYTRPLEFRGEPVPEILRSGNHAAIARYRAKESLRRTRARRPDLFASHPLDALERELVAELDAEARSSGGSEGEG